MMSSVSDTLLYPTAFIDKVKPLIHEGIIEYMAQLDAGDLNAEAQTAAIKAVLMSNRIPSPMEFEPAESFCLASHTDPDDTHETDGPISARDMHLARLLGCACMLAVDPNEGRMVLHPHSTIPILIESTMAVQLEWLSDLAELVRWFRDICDVAADDPQSVWFSNATLARIGLVMILAVQQQPTPEPGTVATAVDDILMRRRIEVGIRRRWIRFIVDIEVFGRAEIPWIRLADRTITSPPAAWTKEDRDAAAQLAHKIIDRELTHPFGIDT